ncbi:hypothetical protein F4808DRAFT_453859 [Astrocystis sublimbata]|nr:hypothetical protein F4808DRAFT_453859 [Astrocystis sublimbata]
MPDELGDCVKQISQHSWLINNKLVLEQTTSAGYYLWKNDDDGSYYVLSTPLSIPEAYPLPPDGHVQCVRLANDSAVWSFGGAFLKVRCRTQDAKTTEEHKTFNIPKVLYHTQADDRTFLFLSRVPGETLDQAWKTMSDDDKQYYVQKVASVCKELSLWTSPVIEGVDGGHLLDTWVTAEMAGYVPPAWVRTKFTVSWGLNFEWPGVKTGSQSLREWRERVR